MKLRRRRRTANFYAAFLDEVDAITFEASTPTAAVLGDCMRAAKRAQMVLDGELPKVGDRGSNGTS